MYNYEIAPGFIKSIIGIVPNIGANTVQLDLGDLSETNEGESWNEYKISLKTGDGNIM